MTIANYIEKTQNSRSLTENDCDLIIESAGLSILAYLEEPEIEQIKAGETTAFSEEIWPAFKPYMKDYLTLHDEATDADGILLANSDKGFKT